MKKLIFLLALSLTLLGCESAREDKRYTLNILNGTGMNQRSTAIRCDSFQMVTPCEAIFWNNGVQQNVKSGSEILPNNVIW